MIKVNVNLLVILQRHGCKMELSLVLLCYTAEKKENYFLFRYCAVCPGTTAKLSLHLA